jgi:cysteine desulfuration protein SufE
MKADLYFIDNIGLRQNLSPTRSNGLLSMVKQMKLFAMAYDVRSKKGDGEIEILNSPPGRG